MVRHVCGRFRVWTRLSLEGHIYHLLELKHYIVLKLHSEPKYLLEPCYASEMIKAAHAFLMAYQTLAGLAVLNTAGRHQYYCGSSNNKI